MDSLETHGDHRMYCYEGMSPEQETPEHKTGFLRQGERTRTLSCINLYEEAFHQAGVSVDVYRCKRNGRICDVLRRFDRAIKRPYDSTSRHTPLLTEHELSYPISFETTLRGTEDLTLFAIGQLKHQEPFTFQNILDILETNNGKAGLTKPEFQTVLDADEAGTDLLRKAASRNNTAQTELVEQLNKRLAQLGTRMRLRPYKDWTFRFHCV